MADLLTDVLTAIRTQVDAHNKSQTSDDNRLLEKPSYTERGIALWAKTKYPAAYLEVSSARNPNALELRASFRKSEAEKYVELPPVTVARLMSSDRPRRYVRDGKRYATAAEAIAESVRQFVARVKT